VARASRRAREGPLWWTLGGPRLIRVYRRPPDWCLFVQKRPVIPGRLDRAKNMPYFPRKNGVSDKLPAVGPNGASGHLSPNGGRIGRGAAPAAWSALPIEMLAGSPGRRTDRHLRRGRGSKVSCATGCWTWATRATTSSGSRRASSIPAGRIMDKMRHLGNRRAAGVSQQNSPKGRRGCETRLQQPFFREDRQKGSMRGKPVGTGRIKVG
jgi:hypothetical protein